RDGLIGHRASVGRDELTGVLEDEQAPAFGRPCRGQTLGRVAHRSGVVARDGVEALGLDLLVAYLTTTIASHPERDRYALGSGRGTLQLASQARRRRPGRLRRLGR